MGLFSGSLRPLARLNTLAMPLSVSWYWFFKTTTSIYCIIVYQILSLVYTKNSVSGTKTEFKTPLYSRRIGRNCDVYHYLYLFYIPFSLKFIISISEVLSSTLKSFLSAINCINCSGTRSYIRNMCYVYIRPLTKWRQKKCQLVYGQTIEK